MSDALPPPFRRVQYAALAVGAAAAVGCAVLAAADRASFLRGYLFAYFAACFVTAGCLGLLALGNLTGGKWAIASRPILTAGVDTTLLVAILFVPIGLGVRDIYVWASSNGEPMFEGAKGIWLSVDFFLYRAGGCLAVWLIAAILVVCMSDVRRAPGETAGMRRAGAIGLVLLVLAMTLAAFDWGMSLEPEWYSSIYGAMLAISGVVAAEATVALVLCHAKERHTFATFAALSDAELPPPEFLTEEAARIRGDVGNLLLAFVMLWAYFSFSQFLIIWSGNLPSEIAWYLPRVAGGWEWLIGCIALLHFAVPFLLLFSRRVKRSAAALAGVSILLLSMYVVNLFWTIKPAFSPGRLTVGLSDVVSLLAVGGIWSAAFLWRLERRWIALERAGGDEGMARSESWTK
jgi:hypothetical protein